MDPIPTTRSSHSIKRRLTLSFGIVIVVLLALNAGFIGVHFNVTRQYQAITDRLILENRFAVAVPQLIDAYFALDNGTSLSTDGKGIIQQKDLDAYQIVHTDIESVVARLDAMTLNPDSALAYTALRNVATNIVKQTDRGIQDLQRGNLVDARANNNDNIIPLKPFIQEDTGDLTAKELVYARVIQSTIQHTDQIIILSSAVLFILVTIFSIIFATLSSNRITRPLTKLTSTAETIAQGNLEVDVSAELLGLGDEIGSLSNSFNAMVQKLRAEVEKQKGSKEVLLGVRTDRELKMISLKKEIAELKARLGEPADPTA